MRKVATDSRSIVTHAASGRLTAPMREADMFFQGRGKVHVTFRRLVKALKRADIDYVVIGGMALNAHGYHRVTNDVDVLVTPEGRESFRARFVGKGYRAISPSNMRRYVDTKSGVEVDLLATGEYPGLREPIPIRFPPPGENREIIDGEPVLPLRTLIELKLAARRWRDFGDVVELIRLHRLDETYAETLHPHVRADYLSCYEEVRREEKYDARA